MVFVNPDQAPVCRWYLQGGPLNGEIFSDWPVPAEGERFGSDYVYRGKRTKRRNRGDYIFGYEPVPVSSPPAPQPQSTPGPQHPAPEADPPGVYEACGVLSDYAGTVSLDAAGYSISTSLGSDRVAEVLRACQWLQAQHPARAAKEAHRWESMRVSQLCDAEHEASIQPEDRATSRAVAGACQSVIDMLVDAGAPRPARQACDHHGRAVSD